MIAYRATLDVPRELAQFVAKLLAAERRRHGVPDIEQEHARSNHVRRPWSHEARLLLQQSLHPCSQDGSEGEGVRDLAR